MNILTGMVSQRDHSQDTDSPRPRPPGFMPATLSGQTFYGMPFTVEFSSGSPVGYGASAGIYKGRCSGPWTRSYVVAVKVYGQILRPVQQELLIRELRTASLVSLRHPLILPFLGTAEIGEQRALVSIYMQNGNLLEYVKSNPGIDKKRLILQVAEAVKYLHTDARLVHGDLKCENVLISDSCNALLADFGLSTFVEKSQFEVTTMTGIREMHTIRFAAPELLLGTNDPTAQRRSKTRESDIYAFGMLVLQAITELPPWSNQTTIAVIQKVSQGQQPPRPSAFMTHLWWNACIRCWSPEPTFRPSIEVVLNELSKPGIDPRRRFTGHVASAASAAYFRCGRKVASGSVDGSIRIWDALTGNLLISPMQGHDGYVGCVAVSPDGRQICSGHAIGTIRRWDAETGAPIGEPMTGHGSYITSVAYSRAGTLIVSGSDDRTVRLWDASTGLLIGEPWVGHRDSVSSVACSPVHTTCVASASLDKTVRLWDGATGTVVWTLEHGWTVLSVCLSSDGIRLVSGNFDGNVQLWNIFTGQLERTIHGHSPLNGVTPLNLSDRVECIGISPSGKHIASVSRDQMIRIWDAGTGDLEAVWSPSDGCRDWIFSVAFSPDGHSVLCGLNGTICIWDLFE